MGLGINNLEPLETPNPTYIDEQGEEQKVKLLITQSKEVPYAFENTTNTIKTFFKKDICDYAPVKVIAGDNFFEWTPFGVGFSDEYGNEEWLGRVNSAEGQVIDGNRIQYKNLISDIDDEFIVNVGELKHNTILNSKPMYNNTLPGKQISIIVDGKIDFSTGITMCVDGIEQLDEFETSSRIEFIDVNGEIVFTLPPPITYEVNGPEKIQSVYKVLKTGNLITLKIFTPYSWLEDPNRVYPVAIDPTVTAITIPSINYTPDSMVFSDDSSFGAIVSNNSRPYVYTIDKVNNTLIPCAEPNGGYGSNVTSMYSITFSRDGKYLIYGDYSQSSIWVYKYNPTTGGFTDRIVQSVSMGSGRIYNIQFSRDGKYVLFTVAAYAYICSFDPNTGLLTRVSTYVNLNGNITISKAVFSNDDKHVIFLNGSSIYVWKYSNGSLGTKIDYLEPIQGYIRDFDLSYDSKCIVFATSTSPFFASSTFDNNTGTIGVPNYPVNSVITNPLKIEISKEKLYIVISQTTSSANLSDRIVIYRFNPSKGVFGERVTSTPPIAVPSANPTSLVISPDGQYLAYIGKEIYMYKFFYEPKDNVFFKDESGWEYYSDNKGNILLLIDFGTIVAGQTTASKKILLENKYDFAVHNIQLATSNVSTQFKVEISKTDVPFIPEQQLFINQTLNTDEEVPFYARITSTDQSQGGGMFEFVVKCDRV